MADHNSESNNNHNGSEFTVIFKKGALKKLKEMAVVLNVPEDRLGDVLMKGLKIIELAKGGSIIIEDQKEVMEIDIKKL